MIITIDCRHFDSSGIGVYLKGILPYFLKTNNRFILLGDKEKLDIYAKGALNCHIAECPIKPFSVKELLFFPSRLKKIINGGDLYFTPYFNIPCGIHVPVYATIHDIIFHDMPALVSKPGLAARMFFYKRAARRAKTIFTVSYFSKSRIQEHLGKRLNVVVTYSAIQEHISTYNTLGIVKQKNIIFIGNIKKHKGLALLLDAFSKLQSADDASIKASIKGYKLIIVGSEDNFRTKDDSVFLQIQALGGAVAYTGYIDDALLCRVTAGAALLVQPSLYEGFCLPPLEAMILGTKALISDIPVLKEIYKDYPVTFFKAGDSGDLKDKMLEIIKSGITSVCLSGEQRNRFTFEKTAARCLDAFEGHP